MGTLQLLLAHGAIDLTTLAVVGSFTVGLFALATLPFGD